MGNVKIDEKLYNRFQYYVLRRLGHKKGNVKVAAEQAVELWIEKVRADTLKDNKVELEDFPSIEAYMSSMEQKKKDKIEV